MKFTAVNKILLFFLFFPLLGTAQLSYFDKYYPQIDSAEYAFSQDNFKEAIKHYSQAFKEVEKPLVRDIYNGVVCHFLTGNIDAAKPWLILLAKKDVDPKLLEVQEAFKEPQIKKGWEAFKPMYEQIRLGEEKDLKPEADELIVLINENIGKHNAFWEDFPKAFVEGDTTQFTAVELKSWRDKAKGARVFTQTIYDACTRYILAHGVPSESEMSLVSEDLLMNPLTYFFDKGFIYSNLHVTSDSLILGKPKAVVIAEVNSKLLSEVDKGHIHRDYVLKLVKMDYKLESLFFIKARIALEIDCGVEKTQLFLKPKLDNPSRYFDKLLGGNDDILEVKGQYAILKNELFLVSNVPIYEDVIIDSCDELQELKAKYKAVDLRVLEQ